MIVPIHNGLVISVLSIVPEQFSERAHEISGLLAEGREFGERG